MIIRSVKSALVATAAVVSLMSPASAQSLAGSPESMEWQAEQARVHDFDYLQTAGSVRKFVALNLLVAIQGNGDYRLEDVSYPYARPATKLFVERLSKQFRSGCGEILTVTSLTRPVSEQPSNAHALSIHPTGMAIDLRVPKTAVCRGWLDRVLLSLERTGVLEATRELTPAHYHVAVFPNQYETYVRSLTRSVPSYIVQQGDRLSTIAQRNGTTVAKISTANGLTSDMIRVGQALRIPN